jgi:hypothetical protein
MPLLAVYALLLLRRAVRVHAWPRGVHYDGGACSHTGAGVLPAVHYTLHTAVCETWHWCSYTPRVATRT